MDINEFERFEVQPDEKVETPRDTDDGNKSIILVLFIILLMCLFI